MYCYAGISRCSIRVGNISRGLTYAKEISSSLYILEIAQVCEEMKQMTEAAQLYEKAESWEKAATT
jgi:WD repeat-containing protein 19